MGSGSARGLVVKTWSFALSIFFPVVRAIVHLVEAGPGGFRQDLLDLGLRIADLGKGREEGRWREGEMVRWKQFCLPLRHYLRSAISRAPSGSMKIL